MSLESRSPQHPQCCPSCKGEARIRCRGPDLHLPALPSSVLPRQGRHPELPDRSSREDLGPIRLEPRFTGNSRGPSPAAGRERTSCFSRAPVAAPDGVVLLGRGSRGGAIRRDGSSPGLLPVPVALDVQGAASRRIRARRRTGRARCCSRVITVAVPPSGDVSVTAVALGTDWRERRAPGTRALDGASRRSEQRRLAAPRRHDPRSHATHPGPRVPASARAPGRRVVDARPACGAHRGFRRRLRSGDAAPRSPSVASRWRCDSRECSRPNAFESARRAAIRSKKSIARRWSTTTRARRGGGASRPPRRDASLLGGATPARATALPGSPPSSPGGTG